MGMKLSQVETYRRAYREVTGCDLRARSPMFQVELADLVRGGLSVVDAARICEDHEKIRIDRERRAALLRAEQVARERVARIVAGAMQRCRNPRRKDYADYGGRGIEFRFVNADHARAWIEFKLGLPKPGQSIDRIDNDRHYEPGNLRWASKSEQARNTRRSRRAEGSE